MVYPLQTSNTHTAFFVFVSFPHVALSVQFVTINMLFTRAYSNIVRFTYSPTRPPKVIPFCKDSVVVL